MESSTVSFATKAATSATETEDGSALLPTVLPSVVDWGTTEVVVRLDVVSVRLLGETVLVPRQTPAVPDGTLDGLWSERNLDLSEGFKEGR